MSTPKHAIIGKCLHLPNARIGAKVRRPLSLFAIVAGLALLGTAALPSVANAAPGTTVDALGTHTATVVCSSAVAGSNPTTYTQAHVVVTATGATPGGDFVYYLQGNDNHTALAATTTADANGNISIDEIVSSYNGTGLLPGNNYGDGIGPAPAQDPPSFFISSAVILGGDCAPANTAPVASVSVSPTSGSTPLVVTANGSASTDDNGVSTYNISWGDGTSTGNQSGATATHTYTTPGTYTVTLTVTDAQGLSDTATKTVTVNMVTPSSSSVPPSSSSAPPSSSSAPPSKATTPPVVIVTDDCTTHFVVGCPSKSSQQNSGGQQGGSNGTPPGFPAGNTGDGLANTGGMNKLQLELGLTLVAFGLILLATSRRQRGARR